MNELEQMAIALDDEIHRRLMAARYHENRKALMGAIQYIARSTDIRPYPLSDVFTERDDHMMSQLAAGDFDVVSVVTDRTQLRDPKRNEHEAIERTLTIDIDGERWALKYHSDYHTGEFLEWKVSDAATLSFISNYATTANKAIKRALPALPFDFALEASHLGQHRVDYLDQIVRSALADPSVPRANVGDAISSVDVASALDREVYRLQVAAHYDQRRRKISHAIRDVAKQYRFNHRFEPHSHRPDEQLVDAIAAGNIDVPHLEGNRAPVGSDGPVQIFDRKVTVVIDSQKYQLAYRSSEGHDGDEGFAGWNQDDANTRAFVRAYPLTANVLREVFDKPQPDHFKAPSVLGKSRGDAIDSMLRDFLAEQALERQLARRPAAAAEPSL